jgi:hypothetical protein
MNSFSFQCFLLFILLKPSDVLSGEDREKKLFHFPSSWSLATSAQKLFSGSLFFQKTVTDLPLVEVVIPTRNGFIKECLFYTFSQTSRFSSLEIKRFQLQEDCLKEKNRGVVNVRSEGEQLLTIELNSVNLKMWLENEKKQSFIKVVTFKNQLDSTLSKARVNLIRLPSSDGSVSKKLSPEADCLDLTCSGCFQPTRIFLTDNGIKEICTIKSCGATGERACLRGLKWMDVTEKYSCTTHENAHFCHPGLKLECSDGVAYCR